VKDGKIDLSWDPATDNVAVASYEIYRDGGYIDTVTTLVYHDTGRTIGQVYHYTVRAVDTAGNKGAFSDIVDQMSTSSSSPTPPTPPAPPASGHMTVNEHPIADLSAGEPYRGYTDEALWLDGSRSHDPDGFLITWAWDFGDGTTGTGERASHSYSHIGLYSVTLTVWDNQGASATDTTTVQILQSNRAPSTPLIRGSRDGFTYLKQYYSIVSTDPDNDLLTYTIEWGDGTTNVSPAMSSDVSYLIAHTWNSSGPYTIHVSVSDGHLTAFNNLTVTIRETPMTNNIALLILGLLILIALLLLFLLSRRKKKNTE
jgi:LPXTG-motif cell wall-anchored protein